MNRREFLKASVGSAVLAGMRNWLPAQPQRGKAPFRVLYGNDTTNINACVSPYHHRGEGFRPEMLEASVDEAVGADAQLLQPGLTWVPLWKSKLYPADEHFQWWQRTFPTSRMHELGKYMLDGGDVVAVFVSRCRSRNVAPFISVRLNDYHRTEDLDAPAGAKLDAFDSLALDRFRRAHSEYRIGHSAGGLDAANATSREIFDARDARVQNWAISEVRQRILAFITEIAENYDIDGIELDFLRHFRLFNLDETTAEQRVTIITRFVAQVRGLLDRTATPGRHRWLCVRIPAVISIHGPLGIEVASLASAGVDMFNLSSNYYTVQQDLDLAAIRQRVPQASVYLEMTHCTVTSPDATPGQGDNFHYRRTTDEQFSTTAYLAGKRGCDGVSLFNFAYYREYHNPRGGPSPEPHFHLLPKLADQAGLAGAPQQFFLAPVWRSPYGNKIQLPRNVASGRKAIFRLEMAPPDGGWARVGRLRIQSDHPMGPVRWSAKINGLELAFANSVAEPYPDPYPAMLGGPETLRAWEIPPTAVRSGSNIIELGLHGGGPVKLIFVDLAMA